MENKDCAWKQIRLEEAADKARNSFVDGPFGSNLKATEYSAEGARLIQLQNIGEGVWLDENQKFIPPRKFKELYRHAAVPGDIAIAKMADPVARACLIPAVADKFIVVADCIKLSPDRLQFDARYLVYAINSIAFRRQAERQSTGTTRRRINLTSLKNLTIWAPCFLEQNCIADILSAADTAIEKTDILIAKHERMKQGLIQDLSTRGIDEDGNIRSEKTHKFKDSPLGRIPQKWELCALSTLAEVDRGKFAHRPRNDPRFYDGPHPFVQTGDVTGARGRILSAFSQTLNERGAAVSREFPTNTIAITIAANIADTAILGCPMYFPDSVVGAVVKSPHSIRYIELCVRRAKRLLEARAPQSAQKNINLEDLRPLLIPVPSLPDEEFRIADIYEAHDRRIQIEEAYKDKLQALKRGLMADLLTGKVRVNNLLKK